jgi:hypothetical protein
MSLLPLGRSNSSSLSKDRPYSSLKRADPRSQFHTHRDICAEILEGPPVSSEKADKYRIQEMLERMKSEQNKAEKRLFELK